MGMNIRDLQREAHEIARSQGWWDEERTFGDLIAPVHSELSEALEAYRTNGLESWHSVVSNSAYTDGGRKLEGVPSELADVVIRVADMAEWYEENLESYVSAHEGRQLVYEGFASTFGEWIMALHMALSNACVSWYVHEESLPVGQRLSADRGPRAAHGRPLRHRSGRGD